MRLFAGPLGPVSFFLLLFSPGVSRADDTGPFSPITFGSGIEFHDSENRFEAMMRFRMQNLFSYETKGTSDLNAILGARPSTVPPLT
jgi:hypothetical protein